DTEVIMREYVKSCKEKCLNYIGENIEIDLRELKKCVAPETVLFELLLGEGIPKPLASESINLIDSKSGKTCSFLNITVLRDRNSLIINKNSKIEKFETVFINNFDELKLLEQFKVSAKLVDYQPDLKINKISNFAYIDFEKLVFPLSLRTWQEGDRFKPFGMKNYRKLSDFLKDEKLNLFEKENLKILESDGKIVWLLGLRLDNRFRISDETKKVLILEKT
ncbi:MAG: tRNA lysidine(34) synthetase TilS, partial [Bacteroidales bacterium]